MFKIIVNFGGGVGNRRYLFCLIRVLKGEKETCLSLFFCVIDRVSCLFRVGYLED